MNDQKENRMSDLSMPQVTVTVDDVYGNGWWEKHREEVLRKWRVELRMAVFGDSCVVFDGTAYPATPWTVKLIILGPAMPRLREVYRTDSLLIASGLEWTGEYRCAAEGELYVSLTTSIGPCLVQEGPTCTPRLILRKTEPRVWFKAEEKARCPRAGDYIWTSSHGWLEAEVSLGLYLCATRHEEQTPAYTLTQEMVDEGRVR